MKIQVTLEHIRKGKRNHENECPVALAINDLTDLKANVNNSIELWDIDYKNLLNEVTMPQVVSDFVCDFNAMLPVKPFEFEVDI